MDSETYYIPVNYTDAGKLFGLFEIRNAIESVVPVSYTHLPARYSRLLSKAVPRE